MSHENFVMTFFFGEYIDYVEDFIFGFLQHSVNAFVQFALFDMKCVYFFLIDSRLHIF